ncbi:MAG: signal peptidase I [Elusimicrobia bacterium]|nr:signal peptidase I [Elusimicrobiota bacterium]MDE2237089.1 signal peptidase I [Elusimicrobiota bacterium]MDE2425307.1 signal peptidase I [Elusimicrobiota bacterium]
MRAGRLLYLFLIAAAVVLPLRAWVIEAIYIPTASMEPTLPVGRHLFCDKLTLRWRRPRRGDIIVFRPPIEVGGEQAEQMVKRVIGLPGETVELRHKRVFIDGKPLQEDYVEHTRPGERLEGDDLGPIVVPPDSYFVLGDNRDESNDSSVWRDAKGRHVYFISAAEIVGLVRGVY